MIAPENAQDGPPIAAPILAGLRQLLARRQSPKPVKILVAGELSETLLRLLVTEVQAASGRLHCTLNFPSEQTLRTWRASAGNTPSFDARVFDLNEEVVGFTIGELDLVAVAAEKTTLPHRAAAGLKRLLKNGGCLLVQSTYSAGVEWKQALLQAGFRGLHARSDQGPDAGLIDVEVLVGSSDGIIDMSAALPQATTTAQDRKDAVTSPAGHDDTGPSPASDRAQGLPASGRILTPPAIQERVMAILEGMLRLAPGDLDPTAPFSEYGVDSIGGVAFVKELNRQLQTELKPTVLFNHASVEKLTTFLSEQCRPILRESEETAGPARTGPLRPRAARDQAPDHQAAVPAEADGFSPIGRARSEVPIPETDIAVIGMSGRFPQADNVHELWDNLAAGKSAITEVPQERWDHRRVYEAGSRDPNKANSKWGGFLKDADKFDPLFFNISGREAEAMDPQQRLFLEQGYRALENAGYTGPSTIRRCGVFVGVEPGDYLQLLMSLQGQSENLPAFQGNAESILAARISYFLDLNGPSIAVNTACSSSLVAVHLACRSLISGECDLALAGGVRVFASEKAYLALGNMGMLSPEGQCKTFDENANGFVPGEAVAVVVLKPLSAAVKDGDHIYGVIKGSAVNQDGRTNGITAPSSVSQCGVQLEVYRRFNLDPGTFQYVEAHGTGTKLGDPIEVEALTNSFRQFTSEKQFCAIGSIKTNLGHTMAAAGVCGLVKVLLCLKHQRIPASLNLQQQNPYIDFEHSPFYVNTGLRPWPAGSTGRRRAALSSFGFSGTNAHLVVEDYTPEQSRPNPPKPAYLFTLSAKTPDALQACIGNLSIWAEERGDDVALEDVSYTLTAGRGHFECRCAFVAGSITEFRTILGQLSRHEPLQAVWWSEQDGRARPDAVARQTMAFLQRDLRATGQMGGANYRDRLSAIAGLYAKGADLEFQHLHEGEAQRRVPLPGYPFARERYWISGANAVPAVVPGLNRLHPLVHQNVSTLAQVQFVSRFDGSEFFFADHQVRGENVLPGVAYLEMVLAAARLAAGGKRFRLDGVTWLRPLTAVRGKAVTLRLMPRGEKTDFEVASGDDKVVHSQGSFRQDETPSPDAEDIGTIRVRCARVESPAALYARCEAAGLVLGDGLRAIREIWVGENEALARLELSSSAQESALDFSLHPGLLDGALQLTAVLGWEKAMGLPVPFQIDEVRLGTLGSRCYAHVVRGPEHRGLLSCEVRLQDKSGKTLVHLKGVAMRVLEAPATTSEPAPTYLRPIWVAKALVRRRSAGLAGRLFLFSDSGSLDQEIAVAAPDLEIVCIRPGEDFRRDGQNVWMRPDWADDFSRLLERGQPDFIVHAWENDSGSVEDFCRRRMAFVFHLCRALASRGIPHPVRTLFVYPPDAHPAHAAVSGFAQTVRQEQPAFTFKLLETERINALSLLDELVEEEFELQVRESDGSRAIKSFEVFAPQVLESICWREHGVYILTGGFGSLGRTFARHLAEQHRARLILLGRSKLGGKHDEFAAELERSGAQVLMVQADVADQEQVQNAVAAGKRRFHGLHGVIHAAGVIRDEFLLKKSWQEFELVLRSKVQGALILDEATRDEHLDFFALFSSIAGVFGNIGQSDYAYANAFLDEFARWRDRRRVLGQRSGRTVSINWPLWRTGGLGGRLGLEERRMDEAGLTALDTETGLAIFDAALRSPETQLMALVGAPQAIRNLLSPRPATAAETPNSRPQNYAVPGSGKRAGNSADPDQTRAALAYLTERLARLIKVPASRIQAHDPFEKFGIDSVMVLEFTRALEEDFGELSKTLLFEHQTVAELAAHFVAHHPDQLWRQTAPILLGPVVAPPPLSDRLPERKPAPAAATPIDAGEIAIIGVFGRYPMAENLEEFWANLRDGKNCIIEIPRERWDYRLFYDPAPGKLGKTQNKWGGFLKDIERFDAPFFSITPREAFAIDPQERIFLETVWRTVEDAGYRRSALAGWKVGVFVGVMYGEYQLYGAGDVAAGSTFPLSSSYASIANRVSYFFNWHGPSIAIDTMCSSSLTAIHLACESLRRGESELAVAGGVNGTLHPHKDALLSPGGFASSEGKCRSFGQGGDGYVPGEGVGAVLLKPLAAALADHDHVYATVKATSVNHGGKTNGYTVPNPKAQADLISTALARGGVDPGTVNYIEAHGTGTPLGDPIEISGLTRAFGAEGNLPACAVGSVKSNIGHLESAAGIAGVTKVLLQMQHGEIAPSLHSEKLNPNIDFANSPFYVPQHLEEWKPVAGGLPVRRAGVSSFGAGGANAHVVLEEFPAARFGRENDPAIPGPFLLVLSARTEDRLRAQAEQLLHYLPGLQERSAGLANVAYTLQVGREPFAERLALIVQDWEDAASKLRDFLSGIVHPVVVRGTARADGNDRETLLAGEEGRAFLAALVQQKKWQKLARAWVEGEEIDWASPGFEPRRVSLPGYPFAGERYWAPEKLAPLSRKPASSPRLHSLVHRNVSDVNGLAFLTCFDEQPAIAARSPLGPISLLEMGAAAARLSSPRGWRQFKDVVWGSAQDLKGPLTLLTRVIPDGDHLRFEVAVRDGAIVLQGIAIPDGNTRADDLDRIRQRCSEPLSPQALATAFSRGGSTMPVPVQALPEIFRGDGELLIRFVRDQFDTEEYADCDLPPVMLQVMIQAVHLLPGGPSSSSLVPFSLASVVLSRLPASGWCHLAGSRSPEGEQTFEITFFSENGELAAQLHQLVLRDPGVPETSKALWLRPVWKERPRPNPTLSRGRLLLLDRTPHFETAIRAQYPGLSVCRVVPGPHFSQRNELIEINPTAAPDYQRAVQSVQPDLIVHRWADDSAEPDAALDCGVLSMVRLTQALLGEPLEAEKRLLFFVPQDTGPASRAVSAYAKTVSLEQPLLQLRVLETDSVDGRLLEEFFAGSDEREIRRQEDRREVLLFEETEPDPKPSVPLRDEGVYLITGGLGGVGSIVAEYLSTRYRARLILTGRTPLNEAGQNRLTQLERAGGRVHYVPANVSNRDDAARMVQVAREQFGPLHGVIHAAGVLHDGFLLRKSLADFTAVLAPKVHGTVILDEVTAGEALDFFVLFSSTAGAFGNVGQSDYAYASAFLDRFAEARELRRSAGSRHGKSISIGWPLWKEGGMSIPGGKAETRLAEFGLYPLPRQSGLALLETALGSQEPHLVALWGVPDRMAQTFLRGPIAEADEHPLGLQPCDPELAQKVERYLKEQFAEVTQLPVSSLDSDQRFEDFGLDSIVVGDFNHRLEKGVGALPKTLLFEFSTFRQLTRHLLSAYQPRWATFFAGNTMPASTNRNAPAVSEWKTLEPLAHLGWSGGPDVSGEDIAIIGLAGRYPKANDLRAFWEILKSGADCVTEIPPDRWDINRYFHPDPSKAVEGKMYSRWGAFVEDADKFDPLFFNIAPLEAELMDPQERLFLETAWLVLEDAGYTRRDLQQWSKERYASNVGVFVGITTNTYPAVARDQSANRTVPTSLPWSLANRVSYLFNFSGPSLSVDTACSSSLVALHLACEAIRHGECQQAIAGGVNLYLHPSKYVHLCLNQMLSKQGQCRAFGEGGDGFVPGEGVGAVLLKPLSLAQAAGDHIYGLIKGSAINHGGRTNGYTVPNPTAQANLVEQALHRARIEAQSVSYIEAHGTGTALGDPVEVAGLAKAFKANARGVVPEAWCALGSVKTNIGHLEAAAGIAGLTKVLLQLKHRQLAPSLHAEKLNLNIEWTGTPFRVQRESAVWKSPASDGIPYPLRAGISSFGAGGANAHVVVEAFTPARGAPEFLAGPDGPVLMVLSARNVDRLRALARNLAAYLSEEAGTPLALIAYTLQVGREALEERVAFCTDAREDLIAKLGQIARGDLQGFAQGRTKREPFSIREEGTSEEAVPPSRIIKDDLEACAREWVGGHAVDWKALWPEEAAMRRVSLPGYVFSRERYWVPVDSPGDEAPKQKALSLLHREESTGTGPKYVSDFTGHEPVLTDHRVNGKAVFPAAATLELVLQAADRLRVSADYRLRQIVWLRPLIVGENGLSLELELRAIEGDRFDFEIRSGEGAAHVQGKIAGSGAQLARERVELGAVRERCLEVVSPEEIYAAFKAGGLRYGPAFQVIKEIRSGDTEALSRLEVPPEWKADRYRLHPALVDGALQSLAVFDAKRGSIALPFTLEECECEEPLGERCYAYVRAEDTARGSRRYHVKLVGEDGLVLARLTGLSVRHLDAAEPKLSLYQPVWKPAALRLNAAIPNRVLLFDDGTDLAAILERSAVPFVRVVAGSRYARHDGIVTIRCSEQTDYERLVGETDFNGIVHRWSLARPVLSERLQRGIYSVHRLTQALLGCGKHVPFLYAYPLGEPAYEAVAGYAKCLRQEQPKIKLKVVGMDQLPGDLLAEMAADDLEVRLRRGKREVRVLEHLNEGQAGDPFRQKGVYLITGGAGALGMIFAEHLHREYNARLILVGRAENPRSRALESLGNDVVYCPGDVSTPVGARRAVQAAKAQFGQLNGILHAAGLLRDGLIRTKHADNFDAVLAPKVLGIQALEEATRDDLLDCLILFSSTAGVLGNAGQSEYAFANAYLDACAHHWGKARDQGAQFGRVLSINWPLWRDGGMTPKQETARLHEQALGLSPLPIAAGLEAFRQALASGVPQCTVIFGTPRTPVAHAGTENQADAMKPSPVSSDHAETAKLQLMDDLKKSVAKVLRLDVGVLEADADTSEYGFDSITFTTLANDLNAAFDFDLTPAVLFEYPTLQAFADYLWQSHSDRLVARYLPKGANVASAAAEGDSLAPEVPVRAPVSPVAAVTVASQRSSGIPAHRTHEPIAVVGMSGIFPGAPNLEVFWRNLDHGTDSITRTPADRWHDVTGSSSPEQALDPPWGGYIDGVDKFDPLVFDISPREAELMDPQQRLFLQTVWHTLDDAGYRKADLAGTKTGVFVGVAANDYASLLAAHGVAVEAYSSTGNAHSVLANRVSYFFDLHGPSEAIDTACSSSLVAIHRAIESIMSGSSEMAIAGGVNVLLSPGAFLAFGKAGMLAADGRCKTFDARANGYVRGEGVGAILLKPLSRAQRDGDRIWGVILGSAENHGGRVQSLTVPNPNAQSQLLQDAYARAGIDPFTIGCIEAHGTGTALGDPLEINGLKKAFGRNTGAVIQPRCAVGSVKTNVGHLETAAGMASIMKILLALRHRRLPGNVHLEHVNPYIQLEGTPFYLPQRSEPWEPLSDRDGGVLPRRAGISSFGFGGANAHVVVEEYGEPDRAGDHSAGTGRAELFLLSARNNASLRESVANLSRHLATPMEIGTPPLALQEIACTLQVGRTAMEERLAVVASSVVDLRGKLERYLQGQRDDTDVFAGSTSKGGDALKLLKELHPDHSYLAPLFQDRQLAKLGRLWVSGVEVNWEAFWPTSAGLRRVRLPGYPFRQDRYWVPAQEADGAAAVPAERARRLHPLLDRNDSTLTAQRYTTSLDPDERVLRDHRVDGRPVLPGAASLELALAGAILAWEGAPVLLRQVAWVRPVAAEAGKVVLTLELRSQGEGQLRFELRGTGDGPVYVLGWAERRIGAWVDEQLDLTAIRARCAERVDSETLYERLARAGLQYGNGFQVIQEARHGAEEVLARLELPAAWPSEMEGYRLHPALVDGALQSLSLLAKHGCAMELPFAVESVECARPLPRNCHAYGRLESQMDGGRRYSLRLADEHGEVLGRLDGLILRALEAPVVTTTVSAEAYYARPIWRLEPEPALSTPGSPVLLLDDETTLSESLARAGVATIRVAGGERYDRCGDHVCLRRDRAEDYHRLIQDVTFGAVIHRWSVAGASLDEALERGLYSLHLLIQVLMKAGRAIPLVYAYPGQEAAYAAVAGYAKSLAQEQPQLLLKVVGFEGGMSATRELVAELSPFEGTPEVRYRKGRREVRTLDEVRDRWGDPASKPALRRGGVFLITGGAGGLGQIFTEYLVQTYDARLVLAGRSETNSSKRTRWWDVLGPDRVSYVQTDVSTAEGARRGVREAKERYGALHGVIHAAGVLRDGLLWRKGRDDFEAVLAPKIRGVEALDDATRQEALDCFILFSSTAALWGNAGQGDYAYANAYLDAFAHQREAKRREGLRSGRTLSLNWPLWADGGMEGNVAGLRATALGLKPLRPATGLKIFERALASGEAQVFGWVGASRPQNRGTAQAASPPDLPISPSVALANVPNAMTAPPTPVTQRQTIDYLVQHFAALTKMDPAQVRPSEPLEKYGFDSILAVEFSQRLSADLGELSKTLLFEYSTLSALADHLLEHHGARLAGMWRPEISRPAVPELHQGPPVLGPGPAALSEVTHDEPAAEEDIAIIGLDGRYPLADDLDEFWANLVAGKDCVQVIPAERWDYRLYFDPRPGQPGRSYNKWGGFLREIDKFDPLFFNVSPREAAILDPQERLFLEVVWNTLENSGYSRRALSGRKVGVYVGVMYGQYQLFGVEESLRQGSVITLSSSYASIANRVSYFFDWRGPSMALDTMCSSALMSIHLACESLKRGETELAVAGGVNLILHPHKEVGLAQAGFLNEEGRCRSFAKVAGRGYIAGEGVGAVLLKPLSAAVRDRDNIQGVIKATVVNHNGRTNGYTVPNPNAQAEVVADGLKKAKLSARSITYVEAAATGSAWGDPIEVNALGKAFQRHTRDTQFCALGSVKSNIGHLESASGIAGLTKVLLQLRHRQLVPSIHAAELNPDIPWDATPFMVQRELAEWQPAVMDGKPGPRRAGVSAFGAAGSNAHVIVEEFCEDSPEAGALETSLPVLIVLSAKDVSGLNARAAQMAAWLRAALAGPSQPPRLIDIAYTLQIGREPMDERVAFQAESVAQAAEQLATFSGLGSGKGFHRGNAAHPTARLARQDEMIPSSTLDRLPPGELDTVAASWAHGADCRWEQLYQGLKPRRLGLPGYSFARERCWYRDDPRPPDQDGHHGSANGHLPRPQPNPGRPGRESAARVIREILGHVLKIVPARIGMQQPFTEVGLDSITTPEVVNEVRRVFGTAVSAGDFIEHATLETFATFLERAHGEASSAALEKSGSDANGHVTLKKKRREQALAPVDYLFAGRRQYTIQVLFFFERHLDFARLRAGLRQVSEAFYPINAQLIRHGKNKYRIRECMDEPDFQEIICEHDAKVPDQDLPETFQPFEVSLEPTVLSEKLAKFRLFQLEHGSLLSVNVSHAIADGYSFYFFVSAWAAACRGEIVPRPDHDRGILRRMARRYKRDKRGSHRNGLGDGAAPFPLLDLGTDGASPRVETLWLDAAEVLAEARRDATSAVRDKLTENGVITAQVWQTYARSLPPTVGELSLACPIDFRRLSPKLSPSFFGNAVAPALLHCPYEQVMEKSVADLAAMISDAVRQCDHRTLMAYNAAADSLRRSKGFGALRRAALVDPRNGLIVTNVARLALSPVDFGTGPFSRELTPVNHPGTAVIVAAEHSTVKVRLAYPEAIAPDKARDVH